MTQTPTTFEQWNRPERDDRLFDIFLQARWIQNIEKVDFLARTTRLKILIKSVKYRFVASFSVIFTAIDQSLERMEGRSFLLPKSRSIFRLKITKLSSRISQELSDILTFCKDQKVV